MVEQLEWTLQLPNGKEENFTGDAPKSIREVVLLDHGGRNRWKGYGFRGKSILGSVVGIALDSAMCFFADSSIKYSQSLFLARVNTGREVDFSPGYLALCTAMRPN